MNTNNIPTELLSLSQFVLWKWKERNGKRTKPPYQANGVEAESNNPATWNTFDAVIAVYERSGGFYDGIGFVLSPDDPYVAIDIDNCIDSNGVISEFAKEIVYKLDSYSEITPSGNGLRIFVRASLPQEGRGRRIGGIDGCSSFEIYEKGRFVTLTGERLSGLPAGIVEAQAGIDGIYKLFFPTEKVQTPLDGGARTYNPPLENEALKAAIILSKHGPAFVRLWDGDTSGYENDDSKADLALCSILAFFLYSDVNEMDRWFRQSRLYRPKWDERRGGGTYGSMTLQKAAETTHNHWQKAGTAPKMSKTGEEKRKRPAASSFSLDEGMTEADLPVIVVSGRADREISAEAWEALRQFNEPPVLYVWGREIARIVRDPQHNNVIVDSVEEQRLLHRLRRVATWRKERLVPEKEAAKDKPSIPAYIVSSDVPVPINTAKDMLADSEQINTLPTLRSVVTAPVVSSTGEMIAAPGYSTVDEIYLATHGIGDAAPLGSTKEDAISAYQRLFGVRGIFGDFPFEADADKAHAVALLFTQFLRPYIADTAPMFLIEAPTAGTGKSKLARNLLRIFTPSPRAWEAPTGRKTEDAEAEWAKVLGAALRDAPPVLFLDNIRGILASTALESLLTSTDPWSTRLLKTSQDITVYPKFLTIVATSNNAEANRDMVRRSVSIRLDSGWERPEERTEFAITDLDVHIEANRTAIISDVLTVISAWIAAGRPENKKAVKGSFERWARIVGGILKFIEVAGFLANEKERATTMDPLTMKWTHFVTLWAIKAKTANGEQNALQAKELLDQAEEAELIPSVADRGASKSLGSQIQKQRDRVFGDWKITGFSGEGGIMKWSLKRADKAKKGLGL